MKNGNGEGGKSPNKQPATDDTEDTPPRYRKPSRPPLKPVKMPGQFTPSVFDELDTRRSIVREVLKRREELVKDCGGDISAQRKTLVDRAAFLSLLLETKEVEAFRTGVLEATVYVQGVNALLGIFKALGLERAPRGRPGHKLDDYVRTRSLET
jgi:hypothetical protein